MASKTSQIIKINNIKLKCKHCSYDKFFNKDVLLNTPGLTFFGIDWLNKSANVFICTRCGFLHWFYPVNETIQKGAVQTEEVEDDISEPSTCMQCKSIIPAGSDTCSACGWSYKEINPE